MLGCSRQSSIDGDHRRLPLPIIQWGCSHPLASRSLAANGYIQDNGLPLALLTVCSLTHSLYLSVSVFSNVIERQIPGRYD